MKTREYEDGDIHIIEPQKDDLIFHDMDALNYIALNTMAWTVLKDKVPVFLLCAYVLWEGVVYAASYTSNKAKSNGLYIVKETLNIIDIVADTTKARRFNTYILEKNPEYIRWIELLGFEHEFTMYSALPDGSNLLGYVKWVRR